MLRREVSIRSAGDVTTGADLTDAFPLVGRQKQLEELGELLLAQHKLFCKRSKQYGDAQIADLAKNKVIPTCCGASGIGKTRFGRDAPLEILKQTKNEGIKSLLEDSADNGLVLRIGFEDELRATERDKPEGAIALRLLFAYGATFSNFAERFPSYNDLYQWCELGSWDVASVSQIVQKNVGERCMLLYVSVDETNHIPDDLLQKDWLKRALSELTRCWHVATSRILVVPFLSGTNPVSVYQISGQGPQNFQLPLLGVDEYQTILRHLYRQPDFEPSSAFRNFLADVGFNPRLFQVHLISHKRRVAVFTICTI